MDSIHTGTPAGAVEAAPSLSGGGKARGGGGSSGGGGDEGLRFCTQSSLRGLFNVLGLLRSLMQVDFVLSFVAEVGSAREHRCSPQLFWPRERERGGVRQEVLILPASPSLRAAALRATTILTALSPSAIAERALRTLIGVCESAGPETARLAAEALCSVLARKWQARRWVLLDLGHPPACACHRCFLCFGEVEVVLFSDAVATCRIVSFKTRCERPLLIPLLGEPRTTALDHHLGLDYDVVAWKESEKGRGGAAYSFDDDEDIGDDYSMGYTHDDGHATRIDSDDGYNSDCGGRGRERGDGVDGGQSDATIINVLPSSRTDDYFGVRYCAIDPSALALLGHGGAGSSKAVVGVDSSRRGSSNGGANAMNKDDDGDAADEAAGQHGCLLMKLSDFGFLRVRISTAALRAGAFLEVVTLCAVTREGDSLVLSPTPRHTRLRCRCAMVLQSRSLQVSLCGAAALSAVLRDASCRALVGGARAAVAFIALADVCSWCLQYLREAGLDDSEGAPPATGGSATGRTNGVTSGVDGGGDSTTSATARAAAQARAKMASDQQLQFVLQVSGADERGAKEWWWYRELSRDHP